MKFTSFDEFTSITENFQINEANYHTKYAKDPRFSEWIIDGKTVEDIINAYSNWDQANTDNGQGDDDLAAIFDLYEDDEGQWPINPDPMKVKAKRKELNNTERQYEKILGKLNKRMHKKYPWTKGVDKFLDHFRTFIHSAEIRKVGTNSNWIHFTGMDGDYGRIKRDEIESFGATLEQVVGMVTSFRLDRLAQSYSNPDYDIR